MYFVCDFVSENSSSLDIRYKISSSLVWNSMSSYYNDNVCVYPCVFVVLFCVLMTWSSCLPTLLQPPIAVWPALQTAPGYDMSASHTSYRFVQNTKKCTQCSLVWKAFEDILKHFTAHFKMSLEKDILHTWFVKHLILPKNATWKVD